MSSVQRCATIAAYGDLRVFSQLGACVRFSAPNAITSISESYLPFPKFVKAWFSPVIISPLLCFFLISRDAESFLERLVSS